MGCCPHWCVGGACIPWASKWTAWSPNLLKNWIAARSLISSLKSIRMIITSPSCCHCLNTTARSSRTTCWGSRSWPCLVRAHTCCWYVVVGLQSLHSQYINTNLVKWLFFPWIQIQHHLPMLELSLPDDCNQWVITLTAIKPVPPGWYGAQCGICPIKSEGPVHCFLPSSSLVL